MADSQEPVFEWVGDFNDLTPEFYMALAQLLLAAHDAQKAREQAGGAATAQQQAGDSAKATER